MSVPAYEQRVPWSDLRLRSGWRRVALEWATALAIASQKMSFIEHLEELRRRIIWSLAFIALAFGGCWAFATDLYELASAPIRVNEAVTLALSRPQDIIGLHIKVTLVAAIFIAAPLVLLQAWLFIAPGLYEHERRYALPFVLSASALFVAGGAFGYFIAFPAALRFLLAWIAESHLVPIIDASEYLNLFFTVIVAMGVVFQIPAVMFVLSRIGLVNARFLLRNLQYAVFGCIVVAAIVTPTSDPWNMLLIAVPMIALYIVGIGVAAVCGRDRTKN
ncbi:MAG TPA: twin-arginine translocase subunit TatC [Vicinamibacterales bacterium]|jgi:sec-independent protein translocase protein TatC